MSENHDWTAVGYMRNNPKMTLEENRRLNIVGKATRDGKIEFIPAVDGWCAIFIDGYWADDFDCLEGELCGFDDIPCGSRYNIEFFPAEPVLSPIKPLSLISIPETLPDGGPYVEIVDGIEWTFMVENGGAVLGSDYDPAIPQSTAGTVEIPQSLGGRSVTEIGEGAFSWCSSVTSLTLPATVTAIHEDAFYRMNSLSVLKFLGDEPVEVGDGAFARVNSDCRIYVTRAKSWNVAIPGTWQGFPISYIPGFDASIVVSPDKPTGTFSKSVALALSAGEGQRIYYTLNGDDPTQSSSVYTSPIQLTQTTEVKFFAVDTETSDWGPVSSVVLTRVASESQDIVVTPSVESGTRFTGSQTVSLDSGSGKTVYYTLDGSDPTTSPTRKVYSEPIVMTSTTTLKYYAVDDTYGDWGVVETAEYILRKPDGGPYTETVDGIEWTYRIVNGEARVGYWPNQDIE
jgi:hypothetical protein